jgi:D-alanyl-D-alanine carboxypeptidase
MKKTIMLVVMLVLVAFVSGAIAAAPPKAATTPAPAPPAKLEKFAGNIKSVNAAAKSFVVAKGKESKIFFADDVKIVKRKDTLSFADLKAGMNLVVKYKKDGEKLIAVNIKVHEPKAAK